MSKTSGNVLVDDNRHLQDTDKITALNSTFSKATNTSIGLINNILGILSWSITVAIIYAGWRFRNKIYITAESGVGYYLGVIGAVIMICLLLYPARKKFYFMRNMGDIKTWFFTHMVLGISGPLLILFHCNFKVGSLNSGVVLISTLVVAISGIIGRYIYTKIHYGLYGRQINLKELREETETTKSALAPIFFYAPKLKEQLKQYEDIVEQTDIGFFGSLFRVFFLGFRIRWSSLKVRICLKRALNVTAKRDRWSEAQKKLCSVKAFRIVNNHMRIVLRITEYRFFERLFALWHLLHLPIFILMIITVIVHVLSVHMY